MRGGRREGGRERNRMHICSHAHIIVLLAFPVCFSLACFFFLSVSLGKLGIERTRFTNVIS